MRGERRVGAGGVEFGDEESAQRFVQRVVNAHELRIRDWLAHGVGDRLRLDGYWHGEVTGRVQLRAMVYAGRGRWTLMG